MSPSEFTEDDAIRAAGRVFYELTGRRVIWPLLTVSESFTLRRGATLRTVRLTNRPVTRVLSATTSSNFTETPLRYELVNSSTIEFVNSVHGNVFCDDQARVDITYEYGARPPVEVLRAMDVLAESFMKKTSTTNPDMIGPCELPANAQSISRQGISLSLQTVDAIIAAGRTGVPEVDKVLSYYNTVKAKRRARIVSSAVPLSTRTAHH